MDRTKYAETFRNFKENGNKIENFGDVPPPPPRPPHFPGLYHHHHPKKVNRKLFVTPFRGNLFKSRESGDSDDSTLSQHIQEIVDRRLEASKENNLEILNGKNENLRLRNVKFEFRFDDGKFPPGFSGIFPFNYFNIIQSQCFDSVYNSDRSLVLSAPTSSGKTVIFELSILRFIKHFKENEKVLYIAPIKALLSEKSKEWKSKFANWLQVTEMTGDFNSETSISESGEIMKHDLILVTPEKWDSITRRYPDLIIYFKVVLIDEVHLLGDGDRGHTLEVVISRIKLRSPQVRFVAVSATIPNGQDIAEWLNNAHYSHYDQEKRPVPLEKIVFGYPSGESSFKFEMKLSYKLAGIVNQYSEGKPTLIFANSRRSAQFTAQILIKDRVWYKKSISVPPDVHDSKLKECLSRGVGFHHGGLESKDRSIIEDLFCRGEIAILVSTTTLALGVNLPAHLVILKGTKSVTLNGAKPKEYDQSQVHFSGEVGH